MYHFIGHIIKPVQKYDYTNKEDTNMTNIEKVNQRQGKAAGVWNRWLQSIPAMKATQINRKGYLCLKLTPGIQIKNENYATKIST